MPSYVNSFASPKYIEETIVNKSGVVGVIRIKPSGVLWKPKGSQKFYSVSLAKFTEWITDGNTKAVLTKS